MTYKTAHRNRVLWLRTCFATFVTILALGLVGSVDTQAAQPTSAPAATTSAKAAPTPTPAPKAAPAAAPVVESAPPAPAAEPTKTETKTQTWWQALLVQPMHVLGLFLAAFLVAGLRKLVKLVETKWKIEIPDTAERLMQEKARWAIGYVEEQAEKRLLHGDGVKTPGAEKLAEVTALLGKFVEDLGYSEEWRKDKIEALAEGVLHLERDLSVGSGDDGRAAKLVAKNGNE